MPGNHCLSRGPSKEGEASPTSLSEPSGPNAVLVGAAMATPWRCRARLHRWQRIRGQMASGGVNTAAAERNAPPVYDGQVDRSVENPCSGV